MKMVEAKPATTVMASSAVERRAWNQVTTTAKAGSYRTIAEVTPIPANTTYSSNVDETRDQPATRSVAARDPAVMRARPPCRSSHRPTGTEAAAHTSRERV